MLEGGSGKVLCTLLGMAAQGQGCFRATEEPGEGALWADGAPAADVSPVLRGARGGRILPTWPLCDRQG